MAARGGDEHTSAGGRGGADEDEEDDYMGDLSLLLPPDSSSSSLSKTRKRAPPDPPQSKPKHAKGLSWQDKRRLERQRKQKEEDERTISGLGSAIPASNIGFRMLKMMGYSPGTALGKDGAGLAEPVGLDIRRSRAGLGAKEEAARKEKDAVEMRRRRENEIAVDFGSRQKAQWRSRRVVADYRKAEATLGQLENREVLEPPKDEDGEGEKTEEEEEEEVITEEDLNGILVKLRDEHRYCLYCGCQYESVEALANNCPGPSEDDH